MYNLLLCHDIHEYTPQTLNIHLTFVNELNDNEYTAKVFLQHVPYEEM